VLHKGLEKGVSAEWSSC